MGSMTLTTNLRKTATHSIIVLLVLYLHSLQENITPFPFIHTGLVGHLLCAVLVKSVEISFI